MGRNVLELGIFALCFVEGRPLVLGALGEPDIGHFFPSER